MSKVKLLKQLRKMLTRNSDLANKKEFYEALPPDHLLKIKGGMVLKELYESDVEIANFTNLHNLHNEV